MKKGFIFFLALLLLVSLFAFSTVSFSEARQYQKGETVFFGTYEQDNNAENGKEPIEWIVSGTTFSGNVIMYSTYILDAKPYNESGEGVKWDDTSLNAWLNTDFKDEAFSDAEKEGISSVRLLQFDELLILIPVAKYGVDATEYFKATYPDLYDSTNHYVKQWCLGPALFASDTVKPFVVYGTYAKTDAMDGYGDIDAVYGIRPTIIVSPDAISQTEHPDAEVPEPDQKGTVTASILPYSDLSADDWNDSVAKVNAGFIVYEYASTLPTTDFVNVLVAASSNDVTLLKEGTSYIVIFSKSDTEAYAVIYRNHEWSVEWRIYSKPATEVIAEYTKAFNYETYTFTGEEISGVISYLLNNL